MNEMQSLANEVRRYADGIGSVDGHDTHDAALARIHDALQLTRAASDLLGATARSARQSDCTWQEIGDAAGVTRQAAFQRFGKPADPRTGEPMNRTAIPHADLLAVDVLDRIRAGEWATVADRFTETMAASFDADALAQAWAHVVASAGDVETVGSAFSRMHGIYTVVDLPIHQEAGSHLMRVSLDDAGKLAGLRFLGPAVI